MAFFSSKDKERTEGKVTTQKNKSPLIQKQPMIQLFLKILILKEI